MVAEESSGGESPDEIISLVSMPPTVGAIASRARGRELPGR
jgi:hypothetical protein